MKNWNRDFLYGNWYFKCQILKFSCLVVYYWTFNLGEGPFALALTTYNMYAEILFFLSFLQSYMYVTCTCNHLFMWWFNVHVPSFGEINMLRAEDLGAIVAGCSCTRR